MKNQLGQSLVEALVALGAAAIVISAVVIAVVSAQNNADFSKNQNLATQFAQQGIEILRQQSEANWTTFSSYTGTYCLSNNSSTLTSSGGNLCSSTFINLCSVNIDNFFTRSITICQNNASCSNGAKVSVTVSWRDGKCNAGNPYCHNVTLDSCLANIGGTIVP